MLLLAVDWTTATAYLLVSAVNCYISYKWSRKLLVTGARKCERMTPVLRELHWLPIRRRIIFKTAVLAYKCQHGAAPQYLQSYCEPTSTCTGRRHLRSAQTRQLIVPRTRTKYGDRSFAVQGPRVWNNLPVELRAPNISVTVFRNRLKTHLFDTT